MEAKKTVMVTMSADEFERVLDVIVKLINEDDHEYGFVTDAAEMVRNYEKALEKAGYEKKWPA